MKDKLWILCFGIAMIVCAFYIFAQMDALSKIVALIMFPGISIYQNYTDCKS